jgi:hypothetical protein
MVSGSVKASNTSSAGRLINIDTRALSCPPSVSIIDECPFRVSFEQDAEQGHRTRTLKAASARVTSRMS